jgi:hypothetical protein
MVTLLHIGYRSFLLPSEQGVQTVLKCLSKAVEVARDRRYEGGTFELETKPMHVSAEMLPDIVLTTRKRSDRPDILEPEVITPKQLGGRRAITPARSQRRLLLED